MPPTAYYRCAELRRIEAAARALPLMQRAGTAAADLAQRLVTTPDAPVPDAPILILAGPGNNGGDAFVAATVLRARGYTAHVVFPGDALRLPTDAADAYRAFVAAGGTTQASIPGARVVPRWSLIIDGLFGIGAARALGAPYAGLVETANALAARDACALLALDCPSGLDAERGTRLGATIRASHTLTFIGAKPGLYTGDGPDCCGAISVAPLGLDTGDTPPGTPCGHTVSTALFAALLTPRARNSHKGSFGTAGVVGGAPGMLGAALLAARAALHLGAGRVRLGLLDERAPPFDAGQPELMLAPAGEVIAGEASALACGPGLGRSDDARRLLDAACARELPLLLDADALNLLAADNEAQARLAARRAPTLVTPHPAEAARLLACSVAEVQADRLASASAIAVRLRAWVALKGCGTVIAGPDGEAGGTFINTSGNPGLATAGSGDVLSGLAVALLAQGWPARDALLAAVHVHGAAADALAAQGCGPVGLTAGELCGAARCVFNRWIATHSARAS
jgi:hydroxyethylthiazole kinase-like uncharacterized protein yjeF